MSMTNHDVPFVVSLIWLAALSGGLIFLLLAWVWHRKLPGLMARLRQQGGLLVSARIVHHDFKLSSKVASFKRVLQNGGNLAIQHFKTAAKLQLFVRYDPLNCGFDE
jgi:hypothetical protein